MLAELLEIARTLYVPAATIADIYIALGDLERGMDYLELAIEERAIIAMWVQWDWHWDPLRKLPRFATLLERTGLKGPRDSRDRI
jgi:hypothetical protein